jgi:hypothetical protein
MSEETFAQEETGLDRRGLLRRGGAVLTGVAGLGVAGVAGASSANVDAGDPVLQGQPNDASPALTGLTSSSPTGTIEVANTATGTPLRVAVTPDTPADDSDLLHLGAGGHPAAADVHTCNGNGGRGASALGLPLHRHLSYPADPGPPPARARHALRLRAGPGHRPHRQV